MKPCANKRKQIAGLAVNALDARSTRELHAHFESCAGCRRYWAELTQITEQLAAAAPDADLRATETFHQRVLAGLEAEAPVSLWARMIGQISSSFNFRTADHSPSPHGENSPNKEFAQGIPEPGRMDVDPTWLAPVPPHPGPPPQERENRRQSQCQPMMPVVGGRESCGVRRQSEAATALSCAADGPHPKRCLPILGIATALHKILRQPLVQGFNARISDSGKPLSLRVALPVAVVALAMLGIWIGQPRRVNVPVSPPVPAGVPVAAADADVDLTPSLANYQRAADQSPDKLDALLARQQPAGGSGPVATAGMMSLGF